MIDVQEATETFDCKTPGCVGEAKSSRGIYAFLCPRCIVALPPRKAPSPKGPLPPEDLPLRDALHGAAGVAPETPPDDASAAVTDAEPLDDAKPVPRVHDAVKALLLPARQLDTALDRRLAAKRRVEQAHTEAQASVARFNEALNDMQEAVREMKRLAVEAVS